MACRLYSGNQLAHVVAASSVFTQLPVRSGVSGM